MVSPSLFLSTPSPSLCDKLNELKAPCCWPSMLHRLQPIHNPQSNHRVQLSVSCTAFRQLPRYNSTAPNQLAERFNTRYHEELPTTNGKYVQFILILAGLFGISNLTS